MAKREPVRVGIVGIGRAGWGMHCAELEPRKTSFRVVAACDVIEERRAKMAKRYGCATYADVRDLVRDPAVELVDVATRTVDHVPHAALALRAGRHVFLEKPIAASYAEARRLERAANSSRGRLFIRHNRRFEPAFQHVREIMASGVLGDVYEVKLRRGGYQRCDDWQTLVAHGGGQLLNWGPHIVDHALRLLDSPLEKLWSDLKRVAAVGDAEDHVKLVMTGRNGRVVDMEISGGAAIGEPEYVVSGTRGTLHCTGSTIRLRHLDPKRKLPARKASAGTPGETFGSAEKLSWVDKTLDVAPRLKVSMPMIWDHLYAALRERKKFPIALAEAMGVMKVLDDAKKGTRFAMKKSKRRK